MNQVSHTLTSTSEHETLDTCTGIVPIVSFSRFICSLMVSIIRLNISMRSSGSQVSGTQIVSIGCRNIAPSGIPLYQGVYTQARPWISISFQVPRAFRQSSYWPRSITLPSSRPGGIFDEASTTVEKFRMFEINCVWVFRFLSEEALR